MSEIGFDEIKLPGHARDKMDAARHALNTIPKCKSNHKATADRVKAKCVGVQHQLDPDETHEARMDALANVLQRLTKRQHELEP
jgi:hypothetical protein